MSKQYDSTNRGALFRNNDRQSDSHPEYRGTINVNGVEFWLSAWIKESPKAGRYFSLSVKAKDARGDRQAQRREPQREQSAAPEFDDDIPF